MVRHAVHAYTFEDRADAGRQLAQRLLHSQPQNPIVLALPRGGVVVGYAIAQALHAPLDVVVARKLGAPGHEELGVGAIAPGGVRVLDQRAIELLGISQRELAATTARETEEIERRLRRYRDGRPEPQIRDRTVILVDDGLATGATARAAIQSVLQQRPHRLILAVPVCSPEAEAALRPEVDQVVCLQSPPDFIAVGFWYREFEQTSDDEVVELLRRAAQESVPGGSDH
jgi:putative phosphoribosyl transferase